LLHLPWINIREHVVPLIFSDLRTYAPLRPMIEPPVMCNTITRTTTIATIIITAIGLIFILPGSSDVNR